MSINPSQTGDTSQPREPHGYPLIPLGPTHRADRFEADLEAASILPPKRPVHEALKPTLLDRLRNNFLFQELETAPVASLLLLLSLLDLLMTYALLRQGIGAYEANPVARWWFTRWNIAGMSFFKFAVIAVVVVACETVERKRPMVGRFILWIGCAAAAAVVARGVSLFVQHAPGGSF